MEDKTTSKHNNALRLLINGDVVSISNVKPTLSLLTFLRSHLQLTGSKEGCAEGDCGACTAVIGELINGQLVLKTINACIQWLPSLDGKAVFTVEYLRQGNGQLHPTQQSMVEHHGSQCGFCTPGIVMSLWQVYNSHQSQGTRASEKDLRHALSGNLCRCTGYRPIIDAGLNMFDLPECEFDIASVTRLLESIKRTDSLAYKYDGTQFLAPKTPTALTQLRKKHPDATLLAGCTDIGLWVNKQLKDVGEILYVGEVETMRDIQTHEHGMRIGAAVTLTDAYTALLPWYPELTQMHERFASLPIRNVGTLGGNVANGSPIGDSLPWLIALGARVYMASNEHEREMLLEDFYLDYMKTALGKDEILMAIEIPKPAPAQVFRTYKLSKRYDSDISAVCAGFSLIIHNGYISEAVIAFGGVAAISRRAPQCEAALVGNRWDEATVDSALHALQKDYTPLSDMRGSADYRSLTAKNLLYRFYLETDSTEPMSAEQTSVYAVT